MINNTRKIIEKMYIGSCDIIIKEKVVNDNYETVFIDKVLEQNVPCKLSYDGALSVDRTQSVSNVSANVTLFINPEIEVLSGSKIVVTQNGRTKTYSCTGDSCIFKTHQQIKLELYDTYS